VNEGLAAVTGRLDVMEDRLAQAILRREEEKGSSGVESEEVLEDTRREAATLQAKLVRKKR
jgi:hypothetical protein